MPVDPLPIYNIHGTKRPARLVVISNTKVERRPERRFSARDGATLAKTFENLLDVQGKDRLFLANKTALEILHAMESESRNKDLRDYGMLIVVLLSHGYTGHIYGSDNKIVVVDHIMEFFRGSNCPAMVGKPKLFIVQACEGEMYQPIGGAATDAGSRVEDATCCIPSEADFLIMWSPVPGNVRWHDVNKECSPFVAALESALLQFKGMEISRLMTRVTQMVCEELEKNAADEFREGGCSLPYMIHMLTKELYFSTITASSEK